MIKPVAMLSSVAALLTVAAGDVAPATGASTMDVLALLREFGFPIFVAVWFMWRLEKRLDRYTEQIEKLHIVVTVMAKTIDAKIFEEGR